MAMISDDFLVDTEEIEWDPSQSTVTAWSAANATRMNKGRRAYGRQGKNSASYESMRSNKKRALQQRQAFPETRDELLEDEEASFDISSSLSSTDRISGSSGSSVSSVDFGRPESFLPPAAPPMPQRFGIHCRSKSISCLPGIYNRSTLRHGRSLSVSSKCDTLQASCSSLSSLNEWSFEQNDENFEPNIVSQYEDEIVSLLSPQPPTKFKKVQATPVYVEVDGNRNEMPWKSRQKVPETELLEVASPSFASPSNNSFSRLARDAELAVAFIKPPNLSPNIISVGGRFAFGDFTEVNTTSPERSIATIGSSSRKRGVCASPMDDAEELSTNSGFSFTRNSSSSLNSRSRSRSRIFSPSSAKKIAEAMAEADFASRTLQNVESIARDKTDDTSDVEDSDNESSKDLDDSDDSSCDGDTRYEHERPGHDFSSSPLPPRAVRRTSTKTFEESIFGTTSAANGAANEIFDSMSSYDDLKFLIKALRKEKLGSTIASFGISHSWTVAPPAVWPSVRRAAFLQWATKELGFSLRAGGGSVAFLQIAISKGRNVLESLETAFITHKKHPPVIIRGKVPDSIPSAMGPVKAERASEFSAITGNNTSPPLFQMRCTPNQVSSRPLGTTLSSRADEDVEIALLRAVQGLAIQESDKVESSACESANFENPLVRFVTMDSNTAISPEYQVSSTLPCFKEDSPRRSSFDNHQPSRLSGDYVSGSDLAQHLHVFSPCSGNGKSRKHSSIRIVTRCSASPFVQKLGTTSRSTQRNGLSFSVDECLETPLVKRTDQFWGSRQQGGRDWGASEPCSKGVLSELIRRFETTYVSSGFAFDSPDHQSDESDNSLACFQLENFASTAANSADLGFEYEVDQREQSLLESENEDAFDVEPVIKAYHTETVCRAGVGSNASVVPNIDSFGDQNRWKQRRTLSFAKHRRVSLCASVLQPLQLNAPDRKSMFVGPILEGDVFMKRESLTLHRARSFSFACPKKSVEESNYDNDAPMISVVTNRILLSFVFSFLNEGELLCVVSPVCSTWADSATDAHATLMLVSVGCSNSIVNTTNAQGYDSDDDESPSPPAPVSSVATSMERPWKFLVSRFPWACFLSEGAFKRVYKVWNSALNVTEAVSVMDVDLIESTGNKSVIGAELAVSVMLSSLVRRNVCPNFVITRGVFTSMYEPPDAIWGSAENRKPKGSSYRAGQPLGRKPREPGAKSRGRYQYIRMELCSEGDVEEFIKGQPDEILESDESRALLFQIAFALHAAGDRFSMKHYDVKLLNVFLQKVVGNSDPNTAVLRYGLGSHVFALRMPKERAVIAKLADYGTANVQAESNGQPVTIAQFTTLENTPPEFLVLGDVATQGHGHDSFGLGLCMLHLFTGHAPYEEVMNDVTCPPTLKQRLCRIWQDERTLGYSVVRSVILSDVYEDDDGNVEGEPDGVLYDTLYRYLVLFGIPDDKSKSKDTGKVWRAISSSLEGDDRKRNIAYGKSGRAARNEGPDAAQFARDRKRYALSHGNNKYIARARRKLEMMEGGMELLLSLVNFDPQKRATPLDVLNSTLMLPLREEPAVESNAPSDELQLSFMAYLTENSSC